MRSESLARLDGQYKAMATLAQKRAESEQIARDCAEAIAKGVPVEVIPMGVSAIDRQWAYQNGIRP